jgi:tetratricopeptide (TPR) repeat protein
MFAAACGARGPAATATATAALAPAPDPDTLIREGCYRCLEAGFAHPAASAGTRFQLAALLALRAKELGLPYTPWTERMDDLLPPGEEWRLYREIVEVVRVDPLSGDREGIFALTNAQRRPVDTVQQWIAALQSGSASSLFRTYLDLTLSCSTGQRQQAIDRAAPLADAPLIQYRIGTCGSQPDLLRLRGARPGFADADLPLGRNALDSPLPDQEEALQRYRAARAAFPDSPVISALIGEIHRDREEWSEALEAYDATLQLVPTHRDAMLGRTVALSNLARHDEAIATATRLIDMGNWLVGGAYFWRAWNRFNLGDVAAARADIDEARSRARSAPTFVLSGMVAWREQRLEFAESEFSEALAIDGGQCEASALLGGVRVPRQLLAEALAAFQHAQQCFDLAIALRRKLIGEIEAGPGTPAGKAGQVARHEREIAEAEKNRNDAMQNAAAIQKRLNPTSR